MSKRKATGINYSLCYIDLDGLISDKTIFTEEMDIITMRIQQVPNDYISIPSDKSLLCDIKVESR